MIVPRNNDDDDRDGFLLVEDEAIKSRRNRIECEKRKRKTYATSSTTTKHPKMIHRANERKHLETQTYSHCGTVGTTHGKGSGKFGRCFP